MRKTFRRWAALVVGALLLLPACMTAEKKVTRVACVGNSITYGAGIANRDANSYPSQLQYFLGDDFEVRNFGVSGTTLLSKGNSPYVKTTAYTQSKDFRPDIVLIKLGTNDSKPFNWKWKDDFVKDYQQLIDSYRQLPSRPRIILLTPVRCYLDSPDNINAPVITGGILPLIEQIAYDNQLEIINLNNIFGTEWRGELFPDRLHPSSIGAGVMARKIGTYLLQPQLPLADISGLQPQEPFNFQGFRGYHFKCHGVGSLIVQPYVQAEGKPWIIRARFWGHEPQTDIALLEAGFHVVYTDVANLYGAPKAVERWDRLYQLMTDNGFHRKVALEGMSRGGLIVYNWAAKNPKKVACIYADAPVMDLKSWPMGEGDYTGSETDIRLMLEAYGFKDKAEALKWKKNPIDHARIIAKAKIPCLHVVGDVDKVVPVKENTQIFAERMAERGRPIHIIHKPGVDHHPHSLANPEPIVNFILKATGRYKNECTHAVPGNEFRSGAGWQQGKEWHSVAKDIEETLEGKRLQLLLLGNSIIQGAGGTRQLVTYKVGKSAFDQQFGAGKWESAGISGDRTQNLLWRIRYGNYNRCQPEYVAIAIGINNLISGNNQPEDVAEGICAVTQEAERQFPQARILLLGLLPSGKQASSEIRGKCDRIHEILDKTRFDRADYINPTAWFVTSDGSLNDDYYSGDYIHLKQQGYEVLARHLHEWMEKQDK